MVSAIPSPVRSSTSKVALSPLPIWLDEWKHPESYSNPALLHTIAAEGIPVQTEQGNGGAP